MRRISLASFVCLPLLAACHAKTGPVAPDKPRDSFYRPVAENALATVVITYTLVNASQEEQEVSVSGVAIGENRVITSPIKYAEAAEDGKPIKVRVENAGGLKIETVAKSVQLLADIGLVVIETEDELPYRAKLAADRLPAVGDEIYTVDLYLNSFPAAVHHGRVSYVKDDPENGRFFIADVAGMESGIGCGAFDERGRLIGLNIQPVVGPGEIVGKASFFVSSVEIARYLQSLK